MSTRVLVVDDHEHLLRAIAVLLKRAGFDVTTASDAESALAMTGEIDVVVVDYHLKSDVTGADVVRHFKQRYGSSVACFVLSGEDDPATRDACFAAGATEVLTKPVSPIELRRLLSDVGNRDEVT